MGIFSKLFSAPDPTAGWPPPTGRPALDLEGGKVGPLHLGDAFEAARALGRPVKLYSIMRDPVLEYPGFELEFADGKLVCVKFDLDGSDRVEVGSHALTRSTTPLDAQVYFGDPTSDSSEGTLRWIDYERGGITLALEFDGGKLGCVQLYNEAFA